MVIIVTPILRVLSGRQPFQRDSDHHLNCRRRHCRQCAAQAQNAQYYNGPPNPNMGQNFNQGQNFNPGPNYNQGPNYNSNQGFNPGPNFNSGPNYNGDPNYNSNQNLNGPPTYQREPPGQMSGSSRDAESSQSSREVTETSYANEKDPVRNSDNPFADKSNSQPTRR